MTISHSMLSFVLAFGLALSSHLSATGSAHAQAAGSAPVTVEVTLRLNDRSRRQMSVPTAPRTADQVLFDQDGWRCTAMVTGAGQVGVVCQQDGQQSGVLATVDCNHRFMQVANVTIVRGFDLSQPLGPQRIARRGALILTCSNIGD